MILPAFRHFRFSFVLVYSEDSVRQLLFIAKPQWVGAYLGDFMGEVMLGIAPTRDSPPLNHPPATGWVKQHTLSDGGLQSLGNDFPILANMGGLEDGSGASHLVASFEVGDHGCIVCVRSGSQAPESDIVASGQVNDARDTAAIVLAGPATNLTLSSFHRPMLGEILDTMKEGNADSVAERKLLAHGYDCIGWEWKSSSNSSFALDIGDGEVVGVPAPLDVSPALVGHGVGHRLEFGKGATVAEVDPSLALKDIFSIHDEGVGNSGCLVHARSI